ncbi:hypothetical protein MH117_12740 [Paenibacillus sp. ACRRX]|uniref:hypothetical protein n=1 Tax=Paenibacillus sp. ACRRX TaxID=2918206 RepID=UPI001EF56DA4|nr:hypothetical protein [Paenibacillus sp. ACRRX]MCG7408292.1 hypothetical protein [Paenibacillus sp. ACRRX]
MVKKIITVMMIFAFVFGTYSPVYALDLTSQTLPSSNNCGCCTPGSALTDETLELATRASGLDSIQILSLQDGDQFISQHVKTDVLFTHFLNQQSIALSSLKDIKVIQTVQDGDTKYTFSIATASDFASLSGNTNEQGTLESLQLVKLKENVDSNNPESVAFDIIDAKDGNSVITLKELTLLKLNAAAKIGLTDEFTTLDIDWVRLGCSLSGALACPVACLAFAALPPVMVACNIGCKAAWELGLCSKAS